VRVLVRVLPWLPCILGVTDYTGDRCIHGMHSVDTDLTRVELIVHVRSWSRSFDHPRTYGTVASVSLRSFDESGTFIDRMGPRTVMCGMASASFHSHGERRG
jgi:hypothetical protein